MQGTHVFGELSGCDAAPLIGIQEVMECVRNIIDQSGLSRVAETSHIFPNGGYTFVICLAESHLAIHTWVDERFVTLDVFACNVTKEQSSAARQVFDRAAEIFRPKDIRVQEVRR